MLSINDDSERKLIQQLAKGDERAFKLIFKFYQNKVYSYAIRIIHNNAIAEEIVQDVFLKIWIKRESLLLVLNFGGYLRTLTRNQTLNAWKKQLAEAKTQLLSHVNWTEESNNNNDEISYRDTLKAVQTALDKLPPQQKAVYYMCRIDGIKADEVAIKLNLSKNTVKVHLQQATKAMRIYLADYKRINGIILLFCLLN